MVKDEVIERLLKIKKENEAIIDEMTFTLRVPRMYHKFIEKFGINNFVLECVKIIKKQEALENRKILVLERLRERKEVSMDNFVKHIIRDNRIKDYRELISNPIS